MIGSVEKAPRLPISVLVFSIEATAGASMSCFIVVAELLEGPRDAEDISEARLFRPEAPSSRSTGGMLSCSQWSQRRKAVRKTGTRCS